MVETHLMRQSQQLHMDCCFVFWWIKGNETYFFLVVCLIDHELFVYLLFEMEIGLSGVQFGLLYYISNYKIG